VDDPSDIDLIEQVIAGEMIPVLVDPNGEAITLLHPKVVVEGRMPAKPPAHLPQSTQLLIGLGAGFVAGENCDAVIETKRGASAWRVIWDGAAEFDTSDHEIIGGRQDVRILRAPVDGIVKTFVEIGEHVVTGQSILQIGSHFLSAPIDGIICGVIHSGLTVKSNTKVAEIDPRDDPRVCDQIPDQAMAAAGGVLEAISSKFGKFR
jgi:xanthine dehydrogenase accessory factor